MEIQGAMDHLLPPALRADPGRIDPAHPYRGSAARHLIGLVLVVGSATNHYRQLLEHYPSVLNCMMNVTEPLRLPRDVPREGDSGFDFACVARIASMPAFDPLVAAGVEIFYRTHLLVVHCRRGRHWSVVVGRAVAAFTGARLWCPCIDTPFSYAIPARVLWGLISPRLLVHAARRARIPFPSSTSPQSRGLPLATR